jgi:hypothetical protein
VNGYGGHCYEFRKQLQELYMDEALLSETLLKPHGRFFIQNYHIYWTDCFPGREGRIATAVTKGIPHDHAEATEVCILTDNSKILLAAKFLCHNVPLITLL